MQEAACKSIDPHIKISHISIIKIVVNSMLVIEQNKQTNKKIKCRNMHIRTFKNRKIHVKIELVIATEFRLTQEVMPFCRQVLLSYLDNR